MVAAGTLLGWNGWRSRLSRTAIASLLLVTASCGSDPPKHDAKKPAAGAMAAPGAPGAPDPAAPPTEGNYIVLGENAKWKPISPLYEAYHKRSVEGITNFTLNNMTSFIDKPIIQEATVDGTGKVIEVGKDPIELDDTCATKAPLERYQLIVLMTGIAHPKAVFTDATGDRCEVIPGDGIGNEGGRITAITQYKVIVTVPGKEKAVVLSIAPPISVLDDQDNAEGDVP